MNIIQDVFNRVVAHLLEQGKKSQSLDIDASGQYLCLYRGPNGAMCAAGFLIMDKYYNPKMEGLSIASTNVWEAIRDGLNEYYGRELTETEEKDLCGVISALQSVHDVHDPEEWPLILRDVAERFELQLPSPQTANYPG